MQKVGTGGAAGGMTSGAAGGAPRRNFHRASHAELGGQDE
jgi:hypothetical protein